MTSINPADFTLLFDVDGTITDSLPGIAAAYRRARLSVGLPEPSPEQVQAMVGPPITQTLGREAGDQAEDAIKAYRSFYDSEAWAMMEVFPGIPELLAKLQAEGWHLATATCKGVPSAKRALAHFDLQDRFEFIGGSDPQNGRITKAEVIEWVLGTYPQVSARPRVLMIGDREHDISGASAHGIDTVAVGWGYGLPEERAKARFVAQDPDDLYRLIWDWAGIIGRG